VSVPCGITFGKEWEFYEICVAEGHLTSAHFKVSILMMPIQQQCQILNWNSSIYL